MPSSSHLLHDPIFRWELSPGVRQSGSLPEILALLSTRDIASFDGLQAHQEHPWFAFLAQVAAMATQRAKLSAPPDDATRWRALLIDLAGGDADAWALYRAELDRPAFLQPPVPEGTVANFKTTYSTPDALDVLLTAKNHDVKSSRARHGGADLWAYALISLQTMQGYSGRGNYGILRMNGGLGNRPVVARVPNVSWGERFRRDVRLLLGQHDAIAKQLYCAEGQGIALLWLEPWSGEDSAELSALDPWFIEICRRVRVVERGGALCALAAPTTAPRVAGGQLSGMTGDPWTPISKEGRSLTLGGGGFTYELVHKLILGGDYQDSLAMQQSGDLYASALVRGQGVTEGFHERYLPIPPKRRAAFARPDERERIGGISGERINAVKKVRNSVLRPAIKALLNGGALDTGARQDKRPDRWVNAFERSIDDIFFPSLWAAADMADPEERDRVWERLLFERAYHQLMAAVASAPIPEARRYQARAAAEQIFRGSFHKNFPNYAQETPE